MADNCDEYKKKYYEALERAKRIKEGKDEWKFSDLYEIVPAIIEIFPELGKNNGDSI